VARASYLPIYNISEAFNENPALDYDLMRKNFAEWKSVQNLLTKDFYPLTAWRHACDLDHWTGFAYDDPASGESVLLAFRMEEAKETSFLFRLPFALPGRIYELRNADTGEVFSLPGEELLKKGLSVTLPEAKTSALFRITRR